MISLTTAKVAEQTYNHYSELTQSCTGEGQPGEENGPDEAWGQCPSGRRHFKGVLWWI